MTTTELGACEWFVWDLRRSNLIDRGQLDQLVSEFTQRQGRAEPSALAQYLVESGALSQFQADRLLQGKSQGLVLGPYTLMDSLGSGSMGTVYKALSKNDNQWYAVKVLPRRSMWNVRIARRQVRAFEQFNHPAVVPFVDVGTAGGTHYLSWPLVEGETLHDLVARDGKLAPGLAALYALQTAEGLDAAHQKELIHGLVKPSNLMVGSDQQIRILDFGIGSLLANSEGESLVDTMSTANTLTSGLDCASPESILEPSNRTPAGDQYSLGCVLYYCLTGRYPFPDGTAVEKMMAHQAKQPVPIKDFNADVPGDLIAVVDRLMGKSPEARFGHTAEVIEALQPLAGPRPAVSARPIKRPERSNGVAVAPPASQSRKSCLAETPMPPAPATRCETTPVPMPKKDKPLVETPPPPKAPLNEPKDLPRIIRTQLAPAPVSRSLEERVGAAGIFFGAMMAACLTWLISLWFFQ